MFRYDERDTIFSRKELKPGTEKFKEYYEGKEQRLAEDNRWRALPGLLNRKAKYHNFYNFAAADSTFETIGALRSHVDHPRKEVEIDSGNPVENSNYIKELAKYWGALECGITKLEQRHIYTHKGRGDLYGKEINNNHKYAIVFTVEMSFDMIKYAPASPTVMESAKQYLNSGVVALQLASFISNLGYDAKAHIDGKYEVACSSLARDAGLGEIGRIGLLMTPKHGPRVRVAVVTTDLPLETHIYKEDKSVKRFCNHCLKCADVCPSSAITDKPENWFLDDAKCFYFWCLSGTDCARCVSTCPYSHRSNILHDSVRWTIRNMPTLIPMIVWFDKLIYGSKPKPKRSKGWLSYK